MLLRTEEIEMYVQCSYASAKSKAVSWGIYQKQGFLPQSGDSAGDNQGEQRGRLLASNVEGP